MLKLKVTAAIDPDRILTTVLMEYASALSALSQSLWVISSKSLEMRQIPNNWQLVEKTATYK